MTKTDSIDENDVLELTREGKSLIEIKRITGANIKIIRRIQTDALNDGYLTSSEIRMDSVNSGTLQMTLLARGDQVPTRSGLNWGLANAHVSPNDAYIPIRISHLRMGHFLSHGTIFDVIWDDGKTMQLVAEGTQPLDGTGIYPKQLCSYPDKFILGHYLRGRLGVPAPTVITTEHLLCYGRTEIDVTFLERDCLEMNFQVR